MDPFIQHFSHLNPLKLLICKYSTTNYKYVYMCRLQFRGLRMILVLLFLQILPSQNLLPYASKHTASSRPETYTSFLSSPVNGNCNACVKLGTGFCYHCKDCQLDIHTLCIYKPSSVNTSTHHLPQQICFSRPAYIENKFQCDICKQFCSNHWLFRCDFCKYDVQMNCAMSNRLQPATRSHKQSNKLCVQ